MSIKITKAGTLTTVQDSGRVGFRSQGIGRGGVMDDFAAAAANCLLGNDTDCAVMEIHTATPEMVCMQPLLLCAAATGIVMTLNHLEVDCWQPVWVAAGTHIAFRKKARGARLYLAVRGGWQVPLWLGSRSTMLAVQAGGCQGRSLQQGDEVAAAASVCRGRMTGHVHWALPFREINAVYEPQQILRCIHSAETNWLTTAQQAAFTTATYWVDNNSNRMGCRLNSQSPLLVSTPSLVSSAVDKGIVQLLPDGNLVVLMTDHQTTGGYPRIAAVISADLPKLAQAEPGQLFSFQWTTAATAASILRQRQQVFHTIRYASEAYIQSILTA